MLMDQIDEENPINSLKNSYVLNDDQHLLGNALRKSQEERSSTANYIVD